MAVAAVVVVVVAAAAVAVVAVPVAAAKEVGVVVAVPAVVVVVADLLAVKANVSPVEWRRPIAVCSPHSLECAALMLNFYYCPRRGVVEATVLQAAVILEEGAGPGVRGEHDGERWSGFMPRAVRSLSASPTLILA